MEDCSSSVAVEWNVRFTSPALARSMTGFWELDEGEVGLDAEWWIWEVDAKHRQEDVKADRGIVPHINGRMGARMAVIVSRDV